MPRFLLTGFGPFLDIADNPSAKLAETSGQPFRILRVSYSAVGEFLDGLDESDFDVLLMLGVAGKRDRLMLELYGRNVRGTTPDVEGFPVAGAARPSSAGPETLDQIDPNGPPLVPSTLWTPELLARILRHPRFEKSIDAGDYLCNDIAYRAPRRFPGKRVGFLHVPPEDRMPLAEQQLALRHVLHQIELD